LLFEKTFDNVPNSNPTIYQFSQTIFNPIVKVVAQDCGTTLGRIATVSPQLEGYVELATGQVITQARVVYLLGQGIYTLAVRDLRTCTAPAGICQSCYAGTYPQNTLPAVGSSVKLTPSYVSSIDQFMSDGKDSSFALSQSPGSYNDTLLFISGVQQLKSAYTISGNGLYLSSIPTLGTMLSLRYLQITNKPFFGYLANTFSGSLLGVKPLPTQNIMVRDSLIKSQLSEGQLDAIENALALYKTVPANYMGYLKQINDPLEKALLMIILYCVYANVHV
jgi:hypothetical protein